MLGTVLSDLDIQFVLREICVVSTNYLHFRDGETSLVSLAV